MRISFALPDIQDEDRAAVLRVLSQPQLTDGEEVRQFELEFAEYLGRNCYAVATSSCYAALHLAWMALGIGPGMEVICPALTHVATAHAISMTGATPVFVDCDPATGNMTRELIEPHLTAKTRAICVMHYCGRPCDMESLMSLAVDRALFVVEDCATALGAWYDNQHVGKDGHCGAFSFYPAKHLTTGEGGMFATPDKWIADKARAMRAFGITKEPRYDVTSIGANYRMSEMAAALGRGQLRRLPESLVKRRRNWGILTERLMQIPGMTVIQQDDEDSEHAAYCVVVQFSDPVTRDRVRDALATAGVESSCYYPQPMPFLSYYRDQLPAMLDNHYTRATLIAYCSLALPCYQQLSEADMAYIGEQVEKAVRG